MNREQARESLIALSLGELDEGRAKEVLGWVEKDTELVQELAELGEVVELATRVLVPSPAPKLSRWRRWRIRFASFRPFGPHGRAFALPIVALASLLLLFWGGRESGFFVDPAPLN